MALTSNAATFPSLNLSNIAPHSCLLKPMSTKHERNFLITAKGILTSLRGRGNSLLQRPASLQPMLDPILEAHEDVTTERNLSSLRGVTGLLESHAFDQSLFNPVTEAQEDVKTEMGILVTAEGNSSSLGGGTGLHEDPNDYHVLRLIFSRSKGETPFLDGENGDGNGMYKVLLLDDECHNVSLVVLTLTRIIPFVGGREAEEMFHLSRQQGFAVVIVVRRLHAEFYVQEMRSSGLRAAMYQVNE